MRSPKLVLLCGLTSGHLLFLTTVWNQIETRTYKVLQAKKQYGSNFIHSPTDTMGDLPLNVGFGLFGNLLCGGSGSGTQFYICHISYGA
jgi:hypothetical protein